MDALLWFHVLMYINHYYYFMFTIGNFGIWIAKNVTPNEEYPTPNIRRDAYFAATLTISELVKLYFFRKYRYVYEEGSIILSLFCTLFSLAALLYVFIIQSPVLRLEYCMDGMLFVLLVAEMIYGVYCFLPWCTAKDY